MVWGIFILLIIVGIYFAPTILAADRKVPNVGSIAVINVFLGWTLVGWVIALAMALRTVPPTPTSTTDNALTAGTTTVAPPELGPGQTMKRCPDCAELVQVEARICRFCRFNFDTGNGADAEEPTQKALPPPSGAT